MARCRAEARHSKHALAGRHRSREVQEVRSKANLAGLPTAERMPRPSPSAGDAASLELSLPQIPRLYSQACAGCDVDVISLGGGASGRCIASIGSSQVVVVAPPRSSPRRLATTNNNNNGLTIDAYTSPAPTTTDGITLTSIDSNPIHRRAWVSSGCGGRGRKRPAGGVLCVRVKYFSESECWSDGRVDACVCGDRLMMIAASRAQLAYWLREHDASVH